MKITVTQPVIEEVFKDFYAVPAFQREYVWQDEQVRALLEDTFDALFDENGSPVDTEYFIGSIVTYPDHEIAQLIDGQQRLTTLFIILCAIRDARRALMPDDDLSHWQGLIRASYADEDGRIQHRFRLNPLYEDAADMLERIGTGDFTPPDDLRKLPASARNFVQAYATASEFLTRFHDEPKDLVRFAARFIKRVRVVRIETASVSEALRIFETINDRGIGLNAMDLLKNLLFMEADPGQHGRLTTIWRDMVRTIEHKDVREKPLRFLRYFLLSRYPDARNRTGKPLTEDDLYDWMSSRKVELGISANPIEFAQRLAQAAQQYRDHVISDLPPLRHLARLSPRARQHFILMLATEGLQREEALWLASRIEALFVAYLLAKEPTKALDLLFANAAPRLRQWTDEVRNLSRDERRMALETLVNAWLEPELAKLAPRVDDALNRLSLERKTMTRFVLARVSQYVEQVAQAPVTPIDHYWEYQIEHILPAQPTAARRAEFDAPADYDKCKQRLGNLCLLEGSINSSIGRDDYAAKQEAYAKSSLLVTRAVGEPQGVGQRAAFARAASLLPWHPTWTSNAIAERHAALCAIARRLWGFPSGANA